MTIPHTGDRPRTEWIQPSARQFQYRGSLRADAFYIERTADRMLLERLIAREFCDVLAPRQVGKSSLRVRTERALRNASVRGASIDLTSIGSAKDANEWFLGLVDELAEALKLAEPFEFWERNRSLPPARRWSKYLREVVLDAIQEPIVLLLDEIDAVRLAPFRVDDFFLSIRESFEARSQDPAFERLTFCLFGAVSPSDLIENKLITPFNVSRSIRLDDFTRAELEALTPGLAVLTERVDALLDAIQAWSDGHPYMTMRICAELAERGRIPVAAIADRVAEVVREVFLNDALHDPNLDYAFRRFDHESDGVTRTEKVALYRQLLAGVEVRPDEHSAAQLDLRLCGMVKLIDDTNYATLRLRNRIFATVFNARWLRTKEEQRFLTEALWHWLDVGKSDEAVLRGKALTAAVRWAETHPLSKDEEEFLRTSLEAERREEARSRRLRRGLTLLLALLIVAATSVLVLYFLRARALDGRERSQHEAEAAKSERDAATRESEKVKEELAKLTTQRESLQKQVMYTAVALSQMERMYADTLAARNSAETALQRERERVTTTATQLKNKTDELEKARAIVDSYDAEIKRLDGDLRRGQLELTELRKKLGQASKALDKRAEGNGLISEPDQSKLLTPSVRPDAGTNSLSTKGER